MQVPSVLQVKHPSKQGVTQFVELFLQVPQTLLSHKGQAPPYKYFPATQDMHVRSKAHSKHSGLQFLQAALAPSSTQGLSHSQLGVYVLFISLQVSQIFVSKGSEQVPHL